MIIIKIDCCGHPQMSSDIMQFEHLDVLRCYAGKRVRQPVYTGSPPTLIYIFSGTAITNLACKYSGINTLTHRVKAVCSKCTLLESELKHLQEVPTKYKYPKWAIDKV